jgi:hypothetical protein
MVELINISNPFPARKSTHSNQRKIVVEHVALASFTLDKRRHHQRGGPAGK